MHLLSHRQQKLDNTHISGYLIPLSYAIFLYAKHASMMLSVPPDVIWNRHHNYEKHELQHDSNDTYTFNMSQKSVLSNKLTHSDKL